MQHKINIQQLKSDRKRLEEQILEIKKELRAPWTKPMGLLQAEHLRLKAQVTELHILRAYHRGRLHLASRPDFCREVAERVALRYQMEEQAA